MARYASHEWHPIPGAQVGTYTGGPKKFIVHTTEGGLAGSLSAYETKHVVPHFTWDYSSRRRLQHVDTASSVSALANDSGGVQTNRDGAIQVEIVGFAADSHNWPDAMLAWLADGIKEVCTREGINPAHAPRFVGAESSPASQSAPQRMSPAAWDGFDGVCGHQHVPENEHWDPGRLDYPKILAFMEDDMPLTSADKAIISEAVGEALDGQAKRVSGIVSWERYMEVLIDAAREGTKYPTAAQVAAAVDQVVGDVDSAAIVTAVTTAVNQALAALPAQIVEAIDQAIPGAVSNAAIVEATKQALREGTASE